ncbi:MAG: hypothetical protein Q7T63_22760 [Burkholderiaceae bacterium]|nr:hypothetical protein [Burkholderiaceae bacterium]
MKLEHASDCRGFRESARAAAASRTAPVQSLTVQAVLQRIGALPGVSERVALRV